MTAKHEFRALGPDDFSFFGFDGLKRENKIKQRIQQVEIRGGTQNGCCHPTSKTCEAGTSRTPVAIPARPASIAPGRDRLGLPESALLSRDRRLPEQLSGKRPVQRLLRRDVSEREVPAANDLHPVHELQRSHQRVLPARVGQSRL